MSVYVAVDRGIRWWGKSAEFAEIVDLALARYDGVGDVFERIELAQMFGGLDLVALAEENPLLARGVAAALRTLAVELATDFQGRESNPSFDSFHQYRWSERYFELAMMLERSDLCRPH